MRHICLKQIYINGQKLLVSRSFNMSYHIVSFASDLRSVARAAHATARIDQWKMVFYGGAIEDGKLCSDELYLLTLDNFN